MKAAVLKKQKSSIVIEEIAKPICGKDELLVRVHACGVCRTDLHILDGDIPAVKLPLVLGHEIIGKIEEVGSEVSRFQVGDFVGIPWLAKTCGKCEYCKREQENLCDKAEFTGYHRDGGFAEYTTCLADYAILLPTRFSTVSMAPFLCAGLIGFRSYRMANPEKSIGFYGFGAAAYLLAQLAIAEGKDVYAFTKKGDLEGQKTALSLGAKWAGDSTMLPPHALDAAIIFAPVGELVPKSLKALKKGGRCVCGGIHMSDIPSFPYKDLWGERVIQSVANLTRSDADAYFEKISKLSIHPHVAIYPLEKVNEAISDLKEGRLQGTAVIDLIR